MAVHSIGAEIDLRYTRNQTVFSVLFVVFRYQKYNVKRHDHARLVVIDVATRGCNHNFYYYVNTLLLYLITQLIETGGVIDKSTLD